MIHNTRTNRFLTQISQILEDYSKNGRSCPIPITVVVAGKIITGIMISEDEYFSFDLTAPWKGIYDLTIKAPRQEYLDLSEEDFDEQIVPDYLKQGFIFLKDAFYVEADKTIPSIGKKGLPIQIRIADIAAFNFGCLEIEKDGL